MKKSISMLLIILFVVGLRLSSCYSMLPQSSKNIFTPAISMGIGFPKIPISHFRAPISVCGGLSTYFNLTNKIIFHLSGNGLYTFNLGSVTKGKSTLKFNLIWGNVCFDYKLKFSMNTVSYLSPGIGYYNLSQQFDEDQYKLNTTGFNIGIITNTLGKKMITQYEIRWHLLFNPEPKPQVLTLKIGFLL